MSSEKPLEGINVLDLSRLVPGPYCTLILADLGARVIKVEDVSGGDFIRWLPPLRNKMSTMFAALNRNKESLSLNLKHPEGREVALKLVERSDVVVESFRPGVLGRLGISFDELARVNPRVILCSITGYGQDGPYAHRPGHDLNYQASSGLLAAQPDGTRVPAVLLGDLVGGGLWPVIAVLSALVRQKSDPGAEAVHLDLSMTEGAMSLLLPEVGADAQDDEKPFEVLKGGYAGYNIYETADKSLLSVAALEGKFLEGLCSTLDIETEASVEGGKEGSEELGKALRSRLAARTASEWTNRLKDFCCEQVMPFSDLVDHPQHRHRKVFFEVGDENTGTFAQLRTPVTRRTDHTPPPLPGQHTRQILAEIGYDEKTMERMESEGIIHTELSVK